MIQIALSPRANAKPLTPSRVHADDELADRLVDALAASPPKPYTEDNRWAAQHGFVGRVPVIGDWFRIPETVQRGWSSVPRVERPRFGASTRIVWDLGDPLESTWVTPVGQSGHPFSPHFSDLVERFHGCLLYTSPSPRD